MATVSASPTRRHHAAPPIPDLSALPDDALLTRRQLSILTGFAIPTLKLWAREGRGPRIVVVENRPRHRAADARDWIRGRAGVLA